MMTTINLSSIKEMLKTMSSKDKDSFIIGLFKHPTIKKIIQERLWGIDIDAYYQQAIQKINKHIFGKRGDTLNKREAKNAIWEYFKATQDHKWYIKLLLYYVERMEQFTREYGDIDESFYMSAENTFHRALEVTDKYGVQAEFLPEIEKIVHKITVEHEYWRGFSDVIAYYFYTRKEKNKQILPA